MDGSGKSGKVYADGKVSDSWPVLSLTFRRCCQVYGRYNAKQERRRWGQKETVGSSLLKHQLEMPKSHLLKTTRPIKQSHHHLLMKVPHDTDRKRL